MFYGTIFAKDLTVMRLKLIYIFIFIVFLGCGSGNSDNNQSFNNQPSVPDTPKNLVASGKNQKISLSWDPVEGAISYNIYFSDTPNIDPSTSIKIPSVYSPYTHNNLDGAKVYYIVTAVSASGESLPSVDASATPAHIFLDKKAVNELDDDGWLLILGAVKNWGDVPACEITMIATINLFTQREAVTVYGGVTGKTMRRDGLTDSACLYPGETGVFQIYTGIPYTIYNKDKGYSLQVEATTDGIEEPVIRDTELGVDPNSEKWGSAWDPEDDMERLTGIIKNLHETATAYIVIVNLVTYDKEGRVTGIYPRLASDGPCQDLDFTDYSCIPASGSASFSITPWRIGSFLLEKAPDYSIYISHLEESDFLLPAEGTF